MTGYEAFCLFTSIKMHFSNPKYDYFKYGGKIKISPESYSKRNDKLNFYKLSKKKDPKGLILANVLSNTKLWVTDCLTSEGETSYKKWLHVNQSLQYIYTQDLSKLDSDFDNNLKVDGDSYPKLLTLYNHNKVNIETLIILNKLVNFIPHWNKKITDSILWPDTYIKIIKYDPFIMVDREIYKKLTVDKFS